VTIGDRLSSRDNALNFVRLALAATVIVSHAWPVGGFGDSPVVGLGGWAVDGFFVLSGYLIAGSRMRNAFLPYLWRRALRILPAFWVCLIVTAAVIAPVTAAVIGETYRLESGVGYVVRNAALSINQWGIDDTLLDVPLAGVWNSPLWTLFFEFGAYVFAGVILSVPLLRRHGALSSAVLFVLIVVFQPLAYGPLEVTTGIYLSGARLGAFFVAGMFLYFVRDRIALRTWLVPAALAVFLVLVFTGQAELFGQLPFAFLIIWIGAILPVRIGVRNDISYGIYIWAFPVQQLIIVAGLSWLGPWGTALLAFVLTVPIAWASWRLVEKPAMRLGPLVSSRVTV
jgi:peptidoglycan/LPS O-acetylase OafA/YrhL